MTDDPVELFIETQTRHLPTQDEGPFVVFERGDGRRLRLPTYAERLEPHYELIRTLDPQLPRPAYVEEQRAQIQADRARLVAEALEVNRAAITEFVKERDETA